MAQAVAEKRRSVRLTPDGWLVIRQESARGVQADAYRVEWRGGFYLLTKTDGTRYNARLGDRPACTCPGFTFRGGCKHISALLALQAAGRLS